MKGDKRAVRKERGKGKEKREEVREEKGWKRRDE